MEQIEIDKAMDKRILKYLFVDCAGIFNCKANIGNMIGTPEHNKVLSYTFFSIPSQHVNGPSVREAIVNAIVKVENRRAQGKGVFD